MESLVAAVATRTDMHPDEFYLYWGGKPLGWPYSGIGRPYRYNLHLDGPLSKYSLAPGDTVDLLLRTPATGVYSIKLGFSDHAPELCAPTWPRGLEPLLESSEGYVRATPLVRATSFELT
jgi:hypothetical protein